MQNALGSKNFLKNNWCSARRNAQEVRRAEVLDDAAPFFAIDLLRLPVGDLPPVLLEVLLLFEALLLAPLPADDPEVFADELLVDDVFAEVLPPTLFAAPAAWDFDVFDLRAPGDGFEAVDFLEV